MAFSGKINLDGAVRLSETDFNIGRAGAAPEEWRFQIGQCVSHISQDMPSLIMGRIRASNGMQFYGVRSFATDDANRDRVISGGSLVPVTLGSEPCQDCLLYNTGMCPGNLY